jgi:hypothetical protein
VSVTDGAIAVYYRSAFDPVTLGIFALFAGCAVYGWFRPSLQMRNSRFVFVAVIIAACSMASVALLILASRLISPGGPQLVIHPDYVACGSWRRDGRNLRVPWHYIIRIVPSGPSLPYQEVLLRFDFDHRLIGDIPWGTHVSSQAWVNCQIDSLTEHPRRLELPANTSDIFDQVHAVRMQARARQPRSYRELMDAARNPAP